MKLLADARLLVVSDMIQFHPLCRARDSSAHQAQLKSIPGMLFQHTDAGEVSRIVCACRRNDSGKGNRHPFEIREPPMSPIEFRNRSAIKECQAMEVSERLCDFVVMRIDLAYPVQRLYLQIPPLTALWPS